MWKRIKEQLRNQLPFVVYRKPKESEVNVIFQCDKKLNRVDDFTESGFVFAPFESNYEAVLVHKDEVLSGQLLAVEKSMEKIDDATFKQPGRDAYIDLVNKTIREIATGSFRKVVLSRALVVDDISSPIELFKKIASTYKNAFCYLWYHPEVGMWLGATPEILLQCDSKNLITMALAGTQKYQGVDKPKWGAKELDEQALVTDYIISALEDKVTDLHQSQLETIKAGELLHLRTKILGTLKSGSLQDIIGALHPTPAVCGFPKIEALNYILKNEDYDRQFYTGFLGELNFGTNNSTKLYVNLRCMQKLKDSMKIYVGGGVTKDSNPEKEWEETVNKSGTMLSVLQA